MSGWAESEVFYPQGEICIAVVGKVCEVHIPFWVVFTQHHWRKRGLNNNDLQTSTSLRGMFTLGGYEHIANAVLGRSPHLVVSKVD